MTQSFSSLIAGREHGVRFRPDAAAISDLGR
jgi:hypothetical protein